MHFSCLIYQLLNLRRVLLVVCVANSEESCLLQQRNGENLRFEEFGNLSKNSSAYAFSTLIVHSQLMQELGPLRVGLINLHPDGKLCRPETLMSGFRGLTHDTLSLKRLIASAIQFHAGVANNSQTAEDMQPLIFRDGTFWGSASEVNTKKGALLDTLCSEWKHKRAS